MGISLKEAIEKSETYISNMMEENKKKKEEFLKKVSEELDKLILINISTILVKPINIPFPIEVSYEYNSDIAPMYKDFTIRFSTSGSSVSIKLADKDWDW